MDAIVNQGSSSHVVVETQVQGQSSTYTHIETSVNGQKQELETTEPGRYELILESSPTIIPITSPEMTIPPSPGAQPSPSPRFDQSKWQTLIGQIRQKLALFLSRLFQFN